MSILDQQCRAAPGVLFADIGSGGGGGGGANPVVSTIQVSTIIADGNTISFKGNVDMSQSEVFISSIGGKGVNGTVVQNGLDFVDGASIYFEQNKMGAVAGITFSGNDGNILGLSTVNGAPYPPAAALPSTTARFAATPNIYVPAAGTNQTVGSFSTVAGSVYQINVDSLRVQNQPAGAPVAGAWSALYVDTTVASYVDTFDMASVSSIANDLQKSGVYTFKATGAGHNLIAQGILTNTLSTAMTFPAQLTLTNLGPLTNMPLVG
jgi:hypothetical protein